MDVVLEGRALLDNGLVDCCIGINGGVIAKVAKTIEGGDRRYNFSGKILMPAGIDLHVHFRDPGMTDKEDFATGSAAAACGGVSYVIDMPNTKPATRTVADFKEKKSSASKKSCVDFGLAALLSAKSDLKGLLAEATVFKAYIGETTGNLGVTIEELSKVLPQIRGADVFVHAEHLKPLDQRVEKSLKDHDARRSEGSEADAARSVATMTDGKSDLHLLHVTQDSILRLARESKATAEVTPHHLLLDIDSRLGTRGKVNPPLRSRATRASLWEAFAAGLADTIGSDHSPHTIDEKDEDFNDAPSGMPGVETLLPLMLDKVAERKLELSVLSMACSRNPARIVGLKKGAIMVGNDADIIAVDLRKSTKIRADNLHSKCGWTPYEGMDGVFPLVTFIRGNEVARDGEISGDRVGKFIAPEGRGT